MTETAYRWMDEDELAKLADIDRQERIRIGYEVRSGELVRKEVNWDVRGYFRQGQGEHTVARQIKFCQDHMRKGARMIGAFEGEKLVGVGVVTPEIRPRLAQLAYLQVSHGYRRHGIAARLTREMIGWAKTGGAEAMYVSATSSDSAVGFYTSQGFTLVDKPLPDLFEQQPADIHMLKKL